MDIKNIPSLGLPNNTTTSYDNQPSDQLGNLISSIELLTKKPFQLTISEEALVKAIEKANKAMEGVQTRLEFSIHEKSKQVIVKVYNKETNEVIREVPPEKIVDLITNLQEINGVIIDEKR
ncbi:hypothetical protein AV654_20155 [Paenibacillus elgii]|uniref:Flagellar biosynthesis protein FlaG n=1 Tax=Paenibacillus elgii TaxID=189691 RepID=A0A161S185_9BACL|nr:flagellar protein FlaG [Paenibacillus elgii]KZE77889.1 hypothetical protein AV654_20155 [Paenibacillus elgii]